MLITIREFVRNILIIIVLAAFLQLILPKGSMRRYAQLALALVMVLTLLGPLLALTRSSWDINELLGQAQTQTAWFELRARSELLQQQNSASLLQTYRDMLGVQVQDIVAGIGEIELVTYQIEFEEDQQAETFGRILSIQLQCKESYGNVQPVYQVSPVQVGAGPSVSQERPELSDWAQDKQRAIQQALAKHFLITEQQVVVTIE